MMYAEIERRVDSYIQQLMDMIGRLDKEEAEAKALFKEAAAFVRSEGIPKELFDKFKYCGVTDAFYMAYGYPADW